MATEDVRERLVAIPLTYLSSSWVGFSADELVVFEEDDNIIDEMLRLGAEMSFTWI